MAGTVGFQPIWNKGTSFPPHDPTKKPATGATAGIPGTWTPAGADVPATPGAMTGITASPATAWTTGQYMQTKLPGTPGQTFWNGTAWTAGKAP